MTANTSFEMLDLVNDQDEIIGSMERNEVYANNLHNFRVINCFIRNAEGKLFIPRRQKHKRLFPLGLDVSAGGHVSSGETYLEAFKKETLEELNLDIETVSYKTLGTLTPHNNNVSAFMTVYEITSNETPSYNQDDFIEHYWLTPKELREKLAKGDYAKEDLIKILEAFY